MTTAALTLALLASTIDARVPDQASVVERLGERVPQDATFIDSYGNRVRLGDVFDGERPVLLVLAYYRCPMLCGLVLRGVAAALQNISWIAGQDYRVLTVSFDPSDTPLSARQSQSQALELLGKGATPERWPFYVGQTDAIRALQESVGYATFRDPNTNEWAHSAAIFALTPEGKVSRYLYGIQFDPKEVKLALFEASQGRLGSTIERVIMRCYSYDATSKRYVPMVQTFLRAGGAVIGVAFFVGLGFLWKRERKRT